jgi:hypothetical protein
MNMSNIKGEQALPIDVPPQPTERFRVWQVPGLRVWFVWDTAKDEAVDLPSGVREDCEHLADLLNYADKADKAGKA